MIPFSMGDGQLDPEERSFESRMSVVPKRAVVLLGAGASASVGCPVMRDFIDLARDYLQTGVFSAEEAFDVEASLNLYYELRTAFSITEQEVDNVENLLSIADLSQLVEHPPLDKLRDESIPLRLRRFIDAVVSKSVRMPSPASAGWLEGDQALGYRRLVEALAWHGQRVSVITTNYDCALEYACYCMGLPFTYSRSDDGALEILKLHGSLNWLRCSNRECPEHDELIVSPLRHQAREQDGDVGHVARVDDTCATCGERLTPMIVPPTWIKQFDNNVLRDAWSRALSVLTEAEAFVAIGYSLPATDTHVRQLLHLGFVPAALRQAAVVVGPDDEAFGRWEAMFRESWRRLDVRRARFERVADTVVLPALVVPRDVGERHLRGLFPISQHIHERDALVEQLATAMEAHNLPNDPTKVDWTSVAARLRRGEPSLGEADSIYRAIMVDLQLDWVPTGTILPVHGRQLGPG